MAPLSQLPALAGSVLSQLEESRIPSNLPSKTLPQPISVRQAAPTTTVTITTGSNNNNNSSNLDNNPGAIAGIVIGSIAGFLLLLWIIYSCTNLGAPPEQDDYSRRAWYDDVAAERRPRSRRRSHRSHHSHHGRHSYDMYPDAYPVKKVSETRMVKPVQAARSPGRPAAIYVQDRDKRRASRSRSRY